MEVGGVDPPPAAETRRRREEAERPARKVWLLKLIGLQATASGTTRRKNPPVPSEHKQEVVSAVTHRLYVSSDWTETHDVITF